MVCNVSKYSRDLNLYFAIKAIHKDSSEIRQVVMKFIGIAKAEFAINGFKNLKAIFIEIFEISQSDKFA